MNIIKKSPYCNDEGFMPPINEIRENMGDKFNELREQLIKKTVKIIPD